MEIIPSLIRGGISFLQRTAGIITKPYETYRSISTHGTYWELPYIAVILAVYFSTASLVKTAAFRPYLLTKQFILLGSAALANFILVVATIWFIGILVGGTGKPGKLILSWAYSLVPTTTWFFLTSLLYVILPPPRTESWKGVTFSLLYLAGSVTLFWWKLTLYYLTLRFSLRLDLARITLVSLGAIPLFILYSVIMYRLGIFRIPFI